MGCIEKYIELSFESELISKTISTLVFFKNIFLKLTQLFLIEKQQ